MQDRLTELKAKQARTKAVWEAEGTAAALRAYIFAQGDYQEWVRTQGKGKG